MNKTLFAIATTALVSAYYASMAYAIAQSPQGTQVHIWEPSLYDSACSLDIFTSSIINQVTGARDQGYQASETWRYQDTAFDTSADECTRGYFDAFAAGAGILAWNTHGYIGLMRAVAFAEGQSNYQGSGKDEGQVKAEQWINGSTGMEIRHTPLKLLGGTSVMAYKVIVLSSWFASNWTADTSEFQPITFLRSCYSASIPNNGSSLIQSVGGRVNFGWLYLSYEAESADDMTLLMERMNGWVSGSRTAGGAYAYGGFSTGFDMYPDPEPGTTLCPSSLHRKAPVVRRPSSLKLTYLFDTEITESGTPISIPAAYSSIAWITRQQWITGTYTLEVDISVDSQCDVGTEFLIREDWSVVRASTGEQQADENMAPNGDIAEHSAEIIR